MSLLGNAGRSLLGGSLADTASTVFPGQAALDRAIMEQVGAYASQAQKRSNPMLNPGDVIVRQVNNGLTVTVYRGDGSLNDVYVATVETLADVIKLACVNNVMGKSK